MNYCLIHGRIRISLHSGAIRDHMRTSLRSGTNHSEAQPKSTFPASQLPPSASDRLIIKKTFQLYKLFSFEIVYFFNQFLNKLPNYILIYEYINS